MNATAPKERFLIISTARSGSNQLVDYVNQTKVALCFGEIVKKAFFDAPGSSKQFDLISNCFPDASQAKQLQLANPEEFWALVSSRVQATKQWTVRPGNSLQRNPPIVFDERRYLAYRDLSRSRFLRIRDRQNEAARYYEIEYSTIASPQSIRTILNNIFQAEATYSETLVKQAPGDPSKISRTDQWRRNTSTIASTTERHGGKVYDSAVEVPSLNMMDLTSNLNFNLLKSVPQNAAWDGIDSST
jgi:hypothetical protein